MSARRPPPRAIFWRRRLLVLAAVFAIAWVAVTVWPSGEEDPTPASASPTPEVSQDADPAPAATTAPPSAAPAADVTVSLASSQQPCDPEQVRITPSVPSGQRAGKAVTVELLVSTVATEACTLEPEDADVVAVVSSGKTAIWDSSVCRSALLDRAVSLAPGWATSVTSRWSGRGSGPACSDEEGFAAGGTYRLRIGTLGGEPGATAFSLDKAAPKPKKKTAEKDDETKDEKADEDAKDEDEG